MTDYINSYIILLKSIT